jgi:alpha-beta hydrolase superfamily lysophospholipase
MLLLGLAGWIGSGLLVVRQLTRRPHPRFAELVPEALTARTQPLVLTTSDAFHIGAWFAPPAQPQRPVFLLIHGIGDSRSSLANLMEALVSRGDGALAISLRAHGDSDGDDNDIGLSARRDVVAAVEYLEQHAPGSPITICGISMGAAAAAYAAPELKDRVAANVLDSMYADLPTATWNRVSDYLPTGLNYLAYASLRVCAPLYLPGGIARYAPALRLKDIPARIPVTFLSGGRDTYATPSEIGGMADSIKDHARFIPFPNAGHARLFARDPAKYLRVLMDAASGN